MIKKNTIKANKIKLSFALSFRLNLALTALLGAQWASAQTPISWCSDEHFDPRITVSEAYQDSDGVAQAMDIDKDDDGLIEICDLEGLNAIRYTLDGSGYRDSATATEITTGCASGGCNGYELVRHLDFFDDASYRTAANRAIYTDGLGWQPIGGGSNRFAAHFNGNRYTLSNLRINRPGSENIALFGSIRGATIENLGLLNVDIVGSSNVGGLVGGQTFTRTKNNIRNNYVVEGRIIGTQRNLLFGNSIGGLIGLFSDSGMITGNYTRVTARGERTIGGLVGNSRSIVSYQNNYAAGTVRGPVPVGGLAGSVGGSSSFDHNYAAVAVTGVNNGGFVNDIGDIGTPTFKHNYWDTERSGQSSSAGQGAGKIEGYNTAAMQAPTAPSTTSTGIYYGWSEEHWDFGTSTQYPAIRYLSGNAALGHRVGDLLPYQRASLRELQLMSASGPLAIDFYTGRFEYYHEVSYDVAEVVVTATTDTAATLRINGTQALSGEPQTVALALAMTTMIEIAVLGTGEITPTSYTVAIFRPTAPLLTELALSHGTLQPSFDTNTRDYTLRVANSIASIAVTTAIALDSNATIEVYRKELDEASRIIPHSAAVALDEGTTTTIHIRVAVSDRGEISEQFYTVAVKRAPSSNAALAALGFARDPTLIAFAAATYQYSVSIEGFDTMDLVLRTANEHARVVVERDANVVAADLSGNYPIALTIGGTTTIQISVTAQDGITTQDYIVTVMQQTGTTAELTELRLSDRIGNPLPLTMETGTQYTAMVFALSQVRLSLEASPGATVMVSVGDQTISQTDDAGMSYYPISLVLGADTTIGIAVTSQDSSTMQNYTLVITHTLSRDASLRNLRVQLPSSATQIPLEIPLNPPFSRTLFAYTATVEVQSQYIVWAQPSTGAMVVSVQTDDTPARRLDIGAEPHYLIDLAIGTMTSVALQTLAQDATARANYTLTIRHTPGTNADLAVLRVTDNFDAELPLDFNPTTSHYTVSAQGATHVMVQASSVQTERRLAADGSVRDVSVARITANGTALSSDTPSTPIALNIADHTTITLIVTAQDGSTTKTYTLVIRQIPNTTAFLEALSLLGGSLSPSFSTATLSYTGTGTHAATLSFTPQASPGATLRVVRTVAAEESQTIFADAHGAYHIALSRMTTTVIAITVTSQDGIATQNYIITVMQQIGTQAELTELRLSDRVGNPLPLMRPTTTQYTAMALAGSQVRLSLEASPGAQVVVRVGNQTVPLTDDAGMSYYPIDLALDAVATIEIAVTSQDSATTEDYSLVIHPIPNTIAFLEALSLSDGSLNPPFSTATLHYTSIDTNAATLSISLQASLGATLHVVRTVVEESQTIPADVHGVYRIDLSRATTTVIAITVTSQDSETTRTYTLSIPPSATRPTSGIRIRSRLFLEAPLP